ncbi:agmatinase [Candidatus Woesearchaeota archaeon]|nr:agmatinase [Candidatus Woesearchaeota archaeon]
MDYLKCPGNFLEIPDAYSNYADSCAVILPFPYEKTTSYIKGTEKGPDAIIKASGQIELYDEEIGNIFEIKISTLKPLITKEMPELMVDAGFACIKEVLDDGKFIVTLGGEHSITSGIVKAFREKYSGLSVLQIDAHSDLREEYQGSRHSHACAMKRVAEICPIVQVGIRSMSGEEFEFVKEKKMNIFWAKDIVDNDNWFNKAISRLTRNVYITLDLDGLDPGIMPSVGTPEPGGLGYYQTLRFLKKVFESRNVVGCDVVELCPNKSNAAPDVTAARIVYKLIGYKFMNEIKVKDNKI